MGVFKWLRRERLTVTTRRSVTPPSGPSSSDQVIETYHNGESQAGTIRTEKYKRDLAEFQARRTSGAKEELAEYQARRTSGTKEELVEFIARRSSGTKEELAVTPEKLKRCGRHVSAACIDCAPDDTFNYEKRSACKYKKNKRSRSNTPEKTNEGVPNIQFLFQNQVFMPGNYQTYSEPRKAKRYHNRQSRSPDFAAHKQLDFKENELDFYPAFKKEKVVNLPLNIKSFLGNGSSDDNVDGAQATVEVYESSQEVNMDSNSTDRLLEAMTELKQLDQWADEQLMPKTPATSRSDDSKNDTSTHGLPVVSSRHLDINMNKGKIWNHGTWGVVPVQIKKLTGVNIDSIRKKQNAEINILRKCRHPNIILLMGIYPDFDDNVHIICERCVDSLFGILHVQGRILSAQTSVKYALDIANALVFLRMHGIMHTQLNSMSIMITSHDTAKLADLGPCAINKKPKDIDVPKDYEEYTAEPRYVNLDDTHSKTSESEPLLSTNPSEVYLKTEAVCKPYQDFINSELYRWQAPELFVPDEMGMVQPCSKSDAYSLSLILWESCNASIPWKLLSYDKLKEQYTLWETGMSLPQDGTYPGGLLAMLQSGLKLKRSERISLEELQENLQTVKLDLDDIGYIMIPARLQQRTKSNFSTSVWDNVSPTDSECQSPQNIEHQAVIHNNRDDEDNSSLTETSDPKSDIPLYESIKKIYPTHLLAQKCRIPEYNDKTDCSASNCYELLPEKDFSSACSTPIAKLRARIKDVETPGSLHRSDSTEYCSILSPNRTAMLAANDDSIKDISYERATAKLSRSFTPKSYKPLHIKVPDCKLESIKPLLREQNGIEKSTYNFDIQNYSLPSTPIARSNKLRKNAWLSGDFGKSEKSVQPKEIKFTENKASLNQNLDRESVAPESPETQPKSSSCSPEVQVEVLEKSFVFRDGEVSPASIESVEGLHGNKRMDPTSYYSSETNGTSERTYDLKLPMNKNHPTYKVDEEVLANMNVKPLVAIHERWIYEANKKCGRSMSLPEAYSCVRQSSALKPASHCVDTLQKSLPQLNTRRSNKTFRTPASPNSNGGNWEQFCQARDTISKGLNLSRESERHRTWSKDLDRATSTEETNKIDQATDTSGIEDFIRDLIRKEFQHLLHEIDETSTVTSRRSEELLAKGVANILESLNYDDHDKTIKKELPKTFSRVKINGNNKPLLQITFNRSGENSLQVLDNCVNVTICDAGVGREPVVTQKLNESLEDTLTEDMPFNALKRCQAFNAIQEAKSTEDLYIDDDFSTHMNENFGGKVKLIPLHGSLHEILCEKEDECCLIKVKQENGCDTIYFRCDNSDTESRDAIDGCEGDTVVYKRSISLIEERIQRIIPKDKRAPIVSQVQKELRPRPKSEVFVPIVKETRVLSASSPSLATHDNEVEVNIENVISYQDSSSDECLNCKSPENDDFEVLEKEIEQEVKISTFAVGLGYMDKISEENLAALNEDAGDKY